MVLPEIIVIEGLRLLQRKSIPLIANRITILIVLKNHQTTGISKRSVSELTEINHNTVVKCRNIYEKDGIDTFLNHGRIGFKPSVITQEEHEKRKCYFKRNYSIQRTSRPGKARIRKDIKYITLLKYVQRNFK